MPIEEKGFDEFSRAVIDIVQRMPLAMREAAQRVAEDWVGKAQSAASTSQQALAASAMTIDVDEETGVTMRNDSPIFFGAEFGGQRRPETMQFPPHRGTRGYWLFPTARANAEHFQEIWGAGVDEAMKEWDNKKAAH